jgi:thymidylate synthase ThyX
VLNIADLSHSTVALNGGGEILVLNTGAIITPEAQAMLGALHSRSPGSVRSHLSIVAKRGPEKFMNDTYVGYGHKSIGDLGDTAVFIEGVSMLAAKAIQDFPLYNGQEVSTRYVDFSAQRFIDPVGSEESASILESWRTFYLHGLSELIPSLVRRFPKEASEREDRYEKAIKARAFDIMRAFLPAGASTNLVWVGPLRQFTDRLPILRHHPLQEIRYIGRAAERVLVKSFRDTFTKKSLVGGDEVRKLVRYPASERYYEQCQRLYAYFDGDVWPEFELSRSTIDFGLLPEYRTALLRRPVKTELPYNIRECGDLQYRYLLDFGSFRDVQRQRSVVMPMPLLTERHSFEPWYLNELPPSLAEHAKVVLATLSMRTDVMIAGFPDSVRQYYTPMGYRTTVRMTGDIRAMVYVTELRATAFVHPTLRTRAVQMAGTLMEHLGPSGLKLHLDPSPDRFDIRRGDHDIVIKD